MMLDNLLLLIVAAALFVGFCALIGYLIEIWKRPARRRPYHMVDQNRAERRRASIRRITRGWK